MFWCGIACFLGGSIFGYFVAVYGYVMKKKEDEEKNDDG